MREREKAREREKNPNQWIVVQRKKLRNHPRPATKTIFIDFLPPDTTKPMLASIFDRYGRIEYISIPSPLRQNKNHRYAFVKFFQQSALHAAIRLENHRKMGDNSIRIHPANRDKSATYQQKLDTPLNHTKKPRKMAPDSRSFAVKDHRTFKEACLNKQPIIHPPHPKPNTHHNEKPNTHQIPPLEPEPLPTCFRLEPCEVRKMSSRALGEDTEKTRDELTVSVIDDEELITIKGARCYDHEDTLKRSVLATSPSSLTSSQILDHVLAEGVTCLHIKPMGGMLHLITFDSIEGNDAILQSKWLDRWFADLCNINDVCASRWRKTQLKVYGVPLRGWGYENFYNIGCMFGRVLSVHHLEFDFATIQVLTDCLFLINCKMAMEFLGKQYKICISEDYSYHQNEARINDPQVAAPATSSSSEYSGGEEEVGTPHAPDNGSLGCNLSSTRFIPPMTALQPMQSKKSTPILNRPMQFPIHPLFGNPTQSLILQVPLCLPPH